MFYNKQKISSICKSIIKNNDIYILSSFTYCIVAFICIVNLDKIDNYLPRFPILIFCVSVFLNGITSFLSDVIFLCHNTIWYNIDVILSTINTLCCILIAIYISYNYNYKKIKIPLVSLYALIIGIISGLLFKHLSVKSINNCNNYIMLHILWHISIPLGVIIAVYNL